MKYKSKVEKREEKEKTAQPKMRMSFLMANPA